MSKSYDQFSSSLAQRRARWFSKMPELAACWSLVIKSGGESRSFISEKPLSGQTSFLSSEDIREPSLTRSIFLPTEITFEVNNYAKRYAGKNIFQEGNIVEMYLGWDARPEFIGAGEIVDVKPRRDKDVGPIYFVTAKSRLHRLHNTENTGTPLRSGGVRLYKEKPSDLLESVPYPPRVFYPEGDDHEVVVTRTKKIKTDAKYLDVDGETLKCFPQVDEVVETQRSIRPRTYKGMRDDQIVGDIVKHFGFDYVFDKTSAKGIRILKKGVSPYAFIQKLALINDFYFWDEYDPDTGRWTAFFKSAENARGYRPGFLYWYGPEMRGNPLIDFDVNRDTEHATTEVEVFSWDTKLKTGIRHRIREEIVKGKSKFVNMDSNGINSAIDMVPVSGASVAFSAFGRRLEVISDKPFRSKEEAYQWAVRYAKARSQDYMTGSGTIIGNPAFDAMQINNFFGLEPDENGPWEVTKARHYLGSTVGYKVEFDARKFVVPGYSGTESFFANMKETLGSKNLSVLFEPLDFPRF